MALVGLRAVEAPAAVVKVEEALRFSRVQRRGDGGDARICNRHRREPFVPVGVEGRVDVLVVRYDARPPAVRGATLRVLERGVYLQVHLFKDAVPDDAGDVAHVVLAARLALDDGGDGERSFERHLLRELRRVALPDVVPELLRDGLPDALVARACGDEVNARVEASLADGWLEVLRIFQKGVALFLRPAELAGERAGDLLAAEPLDDFHVLSRGGSEGNVRGVPAERDSEVVVEVACGGPDARELVFGELQRVIRLGDGPPLNIDVCREGSDLHFLFV